MPKLFDFSKEDMDELSEWAFNRTEGVRGDVMKSRLPKTEFSGGRDDFNLAVGVGAMIKLPSGVYRHAVSTIGKDVSLIDLAKRAEAGAYGVYYKKHMQRVFLRRGIGGDDVLRGNEDLI